jgi:LacI family transcriptional regulator
MSRREPGRATIYDVAEAAGVSHQTVSRVIKGHRVAEPTRLRVVGVMQDLGYRRNLAAQALATNRSRRIGALASELLETGPSKVLQGASSEARVAGYLLDIVSVDPRDERSTREAIDLLRQQDLAAILAISPTPALRAYLRESDLGIPVHVTGDIDDRRFDAPVSLNGIGTRLAIDHLVALGHRDIVLVAGPEGWTLAPNAEYAYQNRLAELGLRASPVLHGDWSPRSGFDLVPALPWGSGFTAVLAGNDQIAMGLLAGLHRRGVDVPGEVSVVGFDGIPEGEFLIPSLTTIGIDFEAGGRTALRNVLRLLEGQEPLGETAEVTPRLLVRGSTGPAPGRARS